MARLLAVAAALAAAAHAAPSNGSVYITNGAWSFVPGIVDDRAVAWGVYTDMHATASAFGSLSVWTNPSFNDSSQAFAAGFVEGALTVDAIYDHYQNLEWWIRSNFGGQPVPQVYQDFFNAQDAWTRAQIAANSSAMWQTVGSIVQQFDGLVAGYGSVAPAAKALDVWAFQQIESVGDLLDLIPALEPGAPYAARFDWRTHSTPESIMDFIQTHTHCSGLFKVDGNFSDIWFGHSAWFSFTSTYRIAKHYNLNLSAAAFKGKQMSFSSYPGLQSSLDDFYQIWDTKIAVIETSNSILNATLYKLIKPQTLFAWQRVRLANHMATTGDEWGYYFSQENSGTYNNAYGVLSLANWAPGKALQPGTLTYVEQIPGLVVYGDVTERLELGYVPMYNVPYFPEIYQASGYPEVFAAFGGESADSPLAGISYQLAPRAQIFRRDQAKVVDMDSFTAIMRYNDWEHDPYSGGSPWGAICSRGDLAPGASASPDGCYDTKASAATWWNNKTFVAINGPTTNGGTLPPFSWTEFENDSHVGLPTTYDFVFEPQTPAWA